MRQRSSIRYQEQIMIFSSLSISSLNKTEFHCYTGSSCHPYLKSLSIPNSYHLLLGSPFISVSIVQGKMQSSLMGLSVFSGSIVRFGLCKEPLERFARWSLPLHQEPRGMKRTNNAYRQFNPYYSSRTQKVSIRFIGCLSGRSAATGVNDSSEKSVHRKTCGSLSVSGL